MNTKISYSEGNLPITEWSVSDRPREKYMAHGAEYVGDAELLAILLRTGTSQESAVDLAKRILAASDNSLNQLSDMSLEDLMSIKGIGLVKAVTVHAAFELGRRRRTESVERQRKIESMTDIVEVMQAKLSEVKHEEFWTIFVNHAGLILKTQRISSGGLTQTVVDVRQIVRLALSLGATGIFLCHNHPSGNLKPSDDDVKVTQQIKEAAALFSIAVLDHVIVHKDHGYSFLAEGILMS